MGNRFSSGKHAIAECDRCGQRYKLTELRMEIIKTKEYQLKVCPQCWDPDHPQLKLGMYPVDDPQAIRQPRRDLSYTTSGLLGGTTAGSGTPSQGSRDTQWGWNPVGGPSSFSALLETPNALMTQTAIGTVTILVT